MVDALVREWDGKKGFSLLFVLVYCMSVQVCVYRGGQKTVLGINQYLPSTLFLN